MVVYKVAFQGERGAYSELAVIHFFPNSTPIPVRSFQEVIETLSSGLCDYAVVPIENSIEGSVNEVYDLLLQSNLYIVGETYQRIHHCLIAIKGNDLGSIKEVFSHPQALAQCRHYVNEKKLVAIPVYDTAGAVKMIKEGQNKRVAAIASKRAAEIYGMEILDVGIEDKKSNFTTLIYKILTDIMLPKSMSIYPTIISPIFGNFGIFFCSILTIRLLRS